MTVLEEIVGRDVSRETMERLEGLIDLLRAWNPRINLVAPSTLEAAWSRHILDSAQLFPLAPDAARWIDLGAGAGFPGLVIAALRFEYSAVEPVALVESDARKAAFLREAARTMGVPINIHVTRIENLHLSDFDVVSARALAPLETLLKYAAPLLAPNGLALFPKGRAAAAEVDEARRSWQFTLDRIPSATSGDSVILAVRDLARV